jgi:hypothetical protein
VLVNDEGEDEGAGESGAGGDEDLWGGEPAAARSFESGSGGEGGVGLLGEEDDLAAVGAIGQMRERGEALVLGQDVFGERAELVGREVRGRVGESSGISRVLVYFLCLYRERGWRRSLQQSSQVEGEVAGIGEHGFFGGAAAEAGGLELFEELFVDVRSEALELAADGGLMHAEQAGDFEQGVLVEEVGGEQEAVFGRELGEDLLERVGELSEFGGFGVVDAIGRRRVRGRILVQGVGIRARCGGGGRRGAGRAWRGASP